jgi:hypothetical protein
MATKAVNYVYCPTCGEEYNTFGPGHECDPRVLAWIKAAKKADKEVRDSGNGAKEE